MAYAFSTLSFLELISSVSFLELVFTGFKRVKFLAVLICSSKSSHALFIRENYLGNRLQVYTWHKNYFTVNVKHIVLLNL